MNKSVTLALDVMSGENDPHSSLQAALKLISVNESVNLHLIGNEEKIKEYLPGRIDDRLSIRHTEEVITMKDSPMDVLRRKKESSMRLAVEMVAFCFCATIEDNLPAGSKKWTRIASNVLTNFLSGEKEFQFKPRDVSKSRVSGELVVAVIKNQCDPLEVEDSIVKRSKLAKTN